jgi:hypothetical protein
MLKKYFCTKQNFNYDKYYHCSAQPIGDEQAVCGKSPQIQQHAF